MNYADIAVDAPIGYDKTFSYSIPGSIDVEPGQLVWVPLGTRPVQGVVFQLSAQPQVEVTKDVLAPVEPSPLISAIGLDLARWIGRYYMASLFESVVLMLPPGFGNRVQSYLQIARHANAPSDDLSPEALKFFDHLASHGEVKEREMVKAMGRDGEREVRRLLNRGLLHRRWDLPRPRMSHHYDRFVRLAATNVDLDESLQQVEAKAPRQSAFYEYLAATPEPVPLAEANKEYGASAVSGLLARGLVSMEWVRTRREPALQSKSAEDSDHPVVLTRPQERALEEITASINTTGTSPMPYLLHGVTGSGKTEVYLRALEHSIGMGKKGIYLVPEISLTPQTVHQLNSRFSGRVALIHSGLTLGERFDQWWRIKDGEYDVVVGPRSALFAPLPDLGLIVLDEEHEWTYKQQDVAPRYHAREVALKLADLSGAVVVMGSATPDVETYYRAKHGTYKLFELPDRIPIERASSSYHQRTPGHPEVGDLAQVVVCDMRQELKEGNRSIFSRPLSTALVECLKRGEQAVLFLNRRGAATVVQCRDCGYVMVCSRCSVTLTYHGTDMRLLCHMCNRRTSPPRSCPQCRSRRIRYLGVGTQRVMEELRRVVPDASALRWDRDTAGTSEAHERVIESFLKGEAQVLVGTQMLAKGLHVPNVTLVGVILADIGLHSPDFRSGERVFELLCQVAGRAGRGPSPGKVVLQTYNPTNYAVVAASKQDYKLLFNHEVRYRQEHGNPPFNQLVRLVYVHTSAQACQREAQRLGRTLLQTVAVRGLTDVQVVGPAPAYPRRAKGRYRWHIVLKGHNLHAFLKGTDIPTGWTVDVDPISVL